jgi:hypothetical protein
LRTITLLILCCLPVLVSAQRQLLLIKNDLVVKRFQQGDDFVYKLKNGKKTQNEFIIALTDSTIITNYDTLGVHQIDRVYFAKGSLMNVFGGFLTAIGGGIFLIDLVNVTLVQQQQFSMDDNVNRISLTSLAIGLPMLLITKKSHKVGYRQRLRIIDRQSLFYYREARN